MTILKLWQLEIGVCFFGSVCHAFMTGVRALTRTWPRCSWRHSTTKWWWWIVSSMLWWAGIKQTIILLSKYIFHLSRLAIQSYNFWTPSTDAGTKLISFSYNTYYDGLLFSDLVFISSPSVATSWWFLWTRLKVSLSVPGNFWLFMKVVELIGLSIECLQSSRISESRLWCAAVDGLQDCDSFCSVRSVEQHSAR